MKTVNDPGKVAVMRHGATCIECLEGIPNTDAAHIRTGHVMRNKEATDKKMVICRSCMEAIMGRCESAGWSAR